MPPLLLGHRGAGATGKIPENTLPAFEFCLRQGCDGFEFDVRRSSDGEAVISHEAIVDAKEIENTPASNLLLPTLNDVLQHFVSRAFLDIELKVSGLEGDVVASLRAHCPIRGFVISSFLPGVLNAIHRLDASIPTGFLCETQDQLKNWQKTRAEWVIPHYKLVDAKLVELVHAENKKVMTWTVNRETEIRAFAQWGADAIISDYPELLISSLQ